MILEHFLLSVSETNCYIVACSETGLAAVIDPGEWNEQLDEFIALQELKLDTILLTHNHHDHTGGIAAVKEKYGAKLAAHHSNNDAEMKLSNGEVFELGSLKIKVLETPGHTEDSMTFVLGCDVFCGDLLFAGSVGGVPDRMSFDQEIAVIREKIIPLGDDMVLHPGHGPASTVHLERLYNPFLIP
ncbi:MBL fold metallo-hydrolase [bacterium]|nr:MBL fold metallo-hydrolase [bacterium]MBU1653041.1 MBL fold metallo-hydrolase [bacterium]MBU1882446.1 MBL fold metallo-hydrolase [bacterium]